MDTPNLNQVIEDNSKPFVYFYVRQIKTFKLMVMKCNVGSTDPIIRIVIGLGIAITGVIFESYWGLIGVVILATGMVKICLMYPLLGINTTKKIA